jgi:hypothetical protein
MTSTTVDGLVADYLRQPRMAASGLPRASRRQLIAEITEHLREARAELADPDQAAVRELLDRIGRPEDIAAAAAEPDSPTVRRFAVVVGAVVVLSGCLTAALILGRTGKNPAADAVIRPSASTGAAVVLPNAVGWAASSAASRLEALGVDVVFVPAPQSSAAAGTVIAELPAAGSTVRPATVVTLTYIPDSTTTPSAGAPTRSSGVLAAAATSTTSPLPSGTYVDGPQGTPHYLVSLTRGRDGQVSGSVDFLYQDGQTAVAFTVTGTVHNGVLTLHTADVQPPAPHSPPLARNVPSVISGTTNSGSSFDLGECTTYLSFAASMADCTFTRSAGH